MDIRQFSFDRQKIGETFAKGYATLRDGVRGILARAPAAADIPDDFATRPTVPSAAEYAAASNAQILERLYNNPAGLLSEQPFIDTLMNVRNAEYRRQHTRHVLVLAYVLVLLAIIAVFKDSPAPPQTQPPVFNAEPAAPQKALENTVGLLKEEFSAKLQAKDLEIKDLKRQLNFLTQGQADLAKQVKALKGGGAKPAAPANPPPAASKPVKPNPGNP